MLDHGRVLQALSSAAGLSGIPDISPYATSQIKPFLSALLHQLRTQAAGRPEDEAVHVVTDLVDKLRSSLSRRNGSSLTVERKDTSESGCATVELEHLLQAIECLATMPAVTTVIASISDAEAHRLGGLQNAAKWLGDFAAEWTKTKARP